MVEFVYPQQQHVDDLVGNMRQCDIDEVMAGGAESPRAAVESSITISTHLAAMHVDDELVCIFGVAPLSILSGSGCPWMLGTNHVKRYRRELMHATRPYIAAMQRAYPFLGNAVHARNTESIRWLRAVGFEVGEPTLRMPSGEMFCLFSRGG